jgi:hypothetical protein
MFVLPFFLNHGKIEEYLPQYTTKQARHMDAPV